MGSWSGSCAISNLHINVGDDIVVFALVKNECERNRFVYNDTLYSFCPLPFYATYNDYGTGTGEHGPAFEPFMKLLSSQLIEYEVGENPYHDIEVTRDAFDAELLWDANHEGRLAIQSYGGKSQAVEMIMVHRRIYDAILSQSHRYMTKNNDGEYGYFYYTFQDVAATVPALVDKIIAELDSLNSEPDVIKKVLKSYMISDSVFKYDRDDRLMAYLASGNHRLALIPDYKNYLVDFTAKNGREATIGLITEFLKGLFINEFVSDTRKLWVPPSGSGSQQQDHAPYLVLIQAMRETLDAEREKWDCDDEDE